MSYEEEDTCHLRRRMHCNMIAIHRGLVWRTDT
jgi:hypothetical protein